LVDQKLSELCFYRVVETLFATSLAGWIICRGAA
jgi:hypothetical protein